MAERIESCLALDLGGAPEAFGRALQMGFYTQVQIVSAVGESGRLVSWPSVL